MTSRHDGWCGQCAGGATTQPAAAPAAAPPPPPDPFAATGHPEPAVSPDARRSRLAGGGCSPEETAEAYPDAQWVIDRLFATCSDADVRRLSEIVEEAGLTWGCPECPQAEAMTVAEDRCSDCGRTRFELADPGGERRRGVVVRRPDGHDWEHTADGWERLPADTFHLVDRAWRLRCQVARMATAPAGLLERLAAPAAGEVVECVAQNPAAPAGLLERLAVDGDGGVRQGVAATPAAPRGVLLRLAGDPDILVRSTAARNPACPEAGVAAAGLLAE